MNAAAALTVANMAGMGEVPAGIIPRSGEAGSALMPSAQTVDAVALHGREVGVRPDVASTYRELPRDTYLATKWLFEQADHSTQARLKMHSEVRSTDGKLLDAPLPAVELQLRHLGGIVFQVLSVHQ
jgi:hypothetical protein